MALLAAASLQTCSTACLPAGQQCAPCHMYVGMYSLPSGNARPPARLPAFRKARACGVRWPTCPSCTCTCSAPRLSASQRSSSCGGGSAAGERRPAQAPAIAARHLHTHGQLVGTPPPATCQQKWRRAVLPGAYALYCGNAPLFPQALMARLQRQRPHATAQPASCLRVEPCPPAATCCCHCPAAAALA